MRTALGRCRSGRTGRIRNPLCQQWHLGFKSLSSRHIVKSLINQRFMRLSKRRFVATVCSVFCSVFCSASLTYESPFFFVFRGVLPCPMPIHTLYSERPSKAFLGAYPFALRIEVAKRAKALHSLGWWPDRAMTNGKGPYGPDFVFWYFRINLIRKSLPG